MTFVRTYDAATAPRGMLRHLLPLFGYPALIWRNRYMIHNFFRRELLGRFHGSFLGVWWLLAQPLFMFAIYYFVFGVLFRDRAAGAEPIEFAIYLFSGVILFYALVEATSTSCNVVVANGNLVKKVAFPSETLVIPIAMNALVIYLVGAVVCWIAGIATGVLHLSLTTLWLPLLLCIQFTFLVGSGLLLANLNVFVRDTAQLWRILTTAWMFLTPVFWSPTMVYAEFGEGKTFAADHRWAADWFFDLNPAYSLLMSSRIALGSDNPVLGEFWHHVAVSGIWAVAMLMLGYSSFTSRKHRYADLV